MKASELIKIIEEGIKQNGDMHVLMEHPIDWAPAPVEFLAVHELDCHLKPIDKADHFTFAVDDDAETVRESFSYQLKLIEV